MIAGLSSTHSYFYLKPTKTIFSPSASTILPRLGQNPLTARYLAPNTAGLAVRLRFNPDSHSYPTTKSDAQFILPAHFYAITSTTICFVNGSTVML
jgi:hypothetical protein